jgi:multiple sugar transport system substrate-binding protein
MTRSGTRSSSSFGAMSLDRRHLFKAGAAATGLAAASRFGLAGAQDATPSADLPISSFVPADVTVSEPVEIEYWQYEYATKTELVNALIPEFEAANPGITIKHVNFPYDDFRQQVAAAVQAGEGPDVLNVFYGWIPAYMQQQFVVPLPADYFPTEAIESAYFPMVQNAKINDAYYALPTAVRTLAMFYNKDILEQAGLEPPANWEEVVSVAQATVVKDGENFEIVGITQGIDGQDHSWWREALIRQNGALPFSDEAQNRTLNWTSPEAIEAFKWLTDFLVEYKVTQTGFQTDGPTAFGSGKAALHVDGSYRLGTLNSDFPDLNYGVVPLPEHKDKASFASFWANTITRNAAEGDKLIAASKFIDFLSSPSVQARWTPAIGELPARTELAADPALLEDEHLAPFIESLPWSYATFTINEADMRQAVMDAYDQVTLNGVDVETALTEAQDKIQPQYDEYWAAIEG